MYSRADFLYDHIVLEELSGSFIKTAQSSSYVPSLVERIKEYLKGKIDLSNPQKSIINFLAPGAIFLALNSIGMPWIGALVSILMTTFKVDVNSIIESICDKIKPYILEGEKFTSSQIKNIVDSTIPLSINEDSNLTSESIFYLKSTFEKFAKSGYDQNAIDKFLDFLKGSGVHNVRNAGIFMKLLRTVLSWLFVVVLASAGFMVAGDAIANVINKGTRFAPESSTIQKKDVDTKSLPTVDKNQDSKFKQNKFYREENMKGKIWSVPIVNLPNNIENMVLDFIEDVYPDLERIESQVRQTPSFKAIIKQITNYNINTPGYNLVFVPPNFKSKKEMADLIIKDLE
ncbi:MAG: hypothetical protein LC122_12990 [Chitinophagales bacterium]|nr:hypothetical protein [Chitinophagales bacterium]